MANFAELPAFLADKHTFVLASDFQNFVTAQDGWTSDVSDAGTSASVSDAANGILALGTAATDNNEVLVRSTTELFLPTANRALFARARLNLTEANTDDANVFFGFASAAGDDLLVDAGAGPRTSGSIFGIYKADGQTVWHGYTRNGATSTDTTSSMSNNMSSGVYQELSVYIQPFDSTRCVVTFAVDDVYLRDATTYFNRIEHLVAYSSLTEMHAAMYVKAGDTNAETLNIDWAVFAQAR